MPAAKDVGDGFYPQPVNCVDKQGRAKKNGAPQGAPFRRKKNRMRGD
jgi:hypothetical protein